MIFQILHKVSSVRVGTSNKGFFQSSPPKSLSDHATVRSHENKSLLKDQILYHILWVLSRHTRKPNPVKSFKQTPESLATYTKHMDPPNSGVTFDIKALTFEETRCPAPHQVSFPLASNEPGDTLPNSEKKMKSPVLSTGKSQQDFSYFLKNLGLTFLNVDNQTSTDSDSISDPFFHPDLYQLPITFKFLGQSATFKLGFPVSPLSESFEDARVEPRFRLSQYTNRELNSLVRGIVYAQTQLKNVTLVYPEKQRTVIEQTCPAGLMALIYWDLVKEIAGKLENEAKKTESSEDLESRYFIGEAISQLQNLLMGLFNNDDINDKDASRKKTHPSDASTNDCSSDEDEWEDPKFEEPIAIQPERTRLDDPTRSPLIDASNRNGLLSGHLMHLLQDQLTLAVDKEEFEVPAELMEFIVKISINPIRPTDELMDETQLVSLFINQLKVDLASTTDETSIALSSLTNNQQFMRTVFKQLFKYSDRLKDNARVLFESLHKYYLSVIVENHSPGMGTKEDIVNIRRQDSGAPFMLHLLYVSLGITDPFEILGLHPHDPYPKDQVNLRKNISSAHKSCCESIGLLNDLVSFEKEIKSEIKAGNISVELDDEKKLFFTVNPNKFYSNRVIYELAKTGVLKTAIFAVVDEYNENMKQWFILKEGIFDDINNPDRDPALQVPFKKDVHLMLAGQQVWMAAHPAWAFNIRRYNSLLPAEQKAKMVEFLLKPFEKWVPPKDRKS